MTDIERLVARVDEQRKRIETECRLRDEYKERSIAAEARVAHLEAGITAAIRKYAFVSPVTFELKKLLDGGGQ